MSVPTLVFKLSFNFKLNFISVAHTCDFVVGPPDLLNESNMHAYFS